MNSGTGKFIEMGKTYELISTTPPREWKNAHFSGPGGKYRYWSRFSNTGKGSAFCVDDMGNYSTLIPESGRKTIWIRDDDTGDVFSPAGFPVPTEVENYSCLYKQESTIIKSSFSGLDLSWMCFVPLNAAWEIWTFTITNRSNRKRRLSIFPYAEIQIDGFDCPYPYGNWHKKALYRETEHCIIARNLYPNPNPELYGALLISSHKPCGAAGGNEPLFNPSYSFSNPGLIKGRDLEKKDTAHDETGEAIALQVRIILEPDAQERIDFSFGIAGDDSHRKEMLGLLGNSHAVDALLKTRADFEKHQNEKALIKTGDDRIDRHFNYWLKKQMHSYLSYKTGIRDNLQTYSAFCGIDRSLTEEQLLRLLSHQRSDGSFPHSWNPVNSRQYSDKPAWLLLTLPALIKETGDLSFLNRKVPFYVAPEESRDQMATVLDHLIRAFDFLKRDRGPGGFNLVHTADWNDDLDGPGKNGGESILVTQIFCAGIRESISLLYQARKYEEATRFSLLYEELKQVLNKKAWEEDRYIRALDGKGGKIGSGENREGRLYLNTQAWAILSGTAEPEKEKIILRQVDRYLDTPFGLKVLDPPYSIYDQSVGSLSASLPGFYVNGIYIHANMFMIAADFMCGRADKGWERLKKVVPDSQANPSEMSQCEPFAMTNCYRSDELRPGLCGDVWHSGSPAWLHLVILEFLAGIKKDYEGLLLDPCLPGEIDVMEVEREFRHCRYYFLLKKRDCHKGKETRGIHRIFAGEEKLEGNLIRHVDGRKEMRIEVII